MTGTGRCVNSNETHDVHVETKAISVRGDSIGCRHRQTPCEATSSHLRAEHNSRREEFELVEAEGCAESSTVLDHLGVDEEEDVLLTARRRGKKKEEGEVGARAEFE